MADRPAAPNTEPARERVDLEETLQWIEDWRAGMFSSTSRDADGWPIEMHGLVADIESLLFERAQLRTALRRIAYDNPAGSSQGNLSTFRRLARAALAAREETT